LNILSPEFLSALAAIIVIDLVLAGDNAIVIALAARDLPPRLRRIAIIGGTAAAVAARAFMTLIIVQLLRVPGLLLAGGILLVWIAWKLQAPSREESKGPAHPLSASGTGLWAAIRAIVIADAAMGMDNILGVAGAARGEFLLVVLGLLISVPIMVLGSTLILKWVEHYPVIVYIGAAVLAWTAARMIAGEPAVRRHTSDDPFIVWTLYGPDRRRRPDRRSGQEIPGANSASAQAGQCRRALGKAGVLEQVWRRLT
jgi:YjbE family integral membrane protein